MSTTSILAGPTPQAGVLPDSQLALPVRTLGQTKRRFGFSRSGSAPYVDPNDLTVIAAGSGMSYSQASSSLVLTSGVTAKSEMILRNQFLTQAAFNLKAGVTASQRIANTQLIIEMVDLIGDALSFTVTSATSGTLTFPTVNPFTVNNVGQSFTLGALVGGTGSIVPGVNNAVIASISGLTVTVTLVGATAGTAGTVSAFGMNYHHVIYDGASATASKWGTQRNGWPFLAGDVAITVNNTASPGHDFAINVQDDVATIHDGLSATNIGQQLTRRGSIRRNMPDVTIPLYLQVRLVNLGTAPTSTTTFSIAYIDIESFDAQEVSLVGARPQSGSAPLPVEIETSIGLTVTNSPSGQSAPGISNDAVAGQTGAQSNAYDQFFNGTTWDRSRNNINIATGDAGTKTTAATVNGATQTNYNARGVILTCILGTVTGTSPTLAVQLQFSPDAGTTWINWGTGISATAIATGNTFMIACYPANMSDDTSQTLAAFTTSATAARLLNAPLPRFWRAVYTYGGTPTSVPITMFASYIN